MWRIGLARYAAEAWSGEGARLNGGRWNRPGTRMIYGSSSLSLAALELFVNLPPEALPPDLIACAATLPDALIADVGKLPDRWCEDGEATRELGETWVRQGTSLGLSVPSAVVPQERNLLVSRVHPDFPSFKALQPVPWRFDPRMFGRGKPQ
ncbi:MAG: RES family NAD+ phosphorylase [Terriglobales bacterium]